MSSSDKRTLNQGRGIFGLLSGKWVIRFAGLLILLALVMLRTNDPEFVRDARFQLFDYYQKVKPRSYTDQPITIVNLDEESLREFGQWPWPRTRIAELIDQLTSLGAIVIAFDVIFAEKDRLSPEEIARDNRALPPEILEALGKLESNESRMAKSMAASRVVLGQTSIREYGESYGTAREILDAPYAAIGEDPRPYLRRFPQLVENLPGLEQAAVGRGVFSLSPDPDGIVRRVPVVMLVGGKVRLGLSIEALRIASGGESFAIRTSINGIEGLVVARNLISTDENGRIWVYYSEPDSARYVSAASVLDGTVDASRIANHIILVGTSAIGLEDYRPIPLGTQVPGVEIHAQVMENVFTGNLLSRSPRALLYEVMVTILAGLLLVLVGYRTSAGIATAMTIGLVFVGMAFSWWSFSANLVLFDITWPIGSVMALSVFGMVANYLREERQRQQIQGAFGQYLSPALVDQLSENPGKLELGGEARELSVLFTDVRGFTTISESYRHNPQALTLLMNEFLTELSQPILDHNGTIDKYMGDAIMAFWNAPLEEDDHAYMACVAALDMIAAVEALNSRHIASRDAGMEEEFHSLNVGIGINSGMCVVGNMGSRNRFDYTALGDTVNLASRLEGQSKPYGLPIVIGDTTALLVDERLATFEIDLIRVKGKNEPARIHCLAGDGAMLASDAFSEFVKLNNSMITSYRNQDWEAAEAALELMEKSGEKLGLPVSSYAFIYENRINEFVANPPSRNWDGVYTAITK